MPIYRVDVKATWIESYYIEADTQEIAISKTLEDGEGMYQGEMIDSEHHDSEEVAAFPSDHIS